MFTGRDQEDLVGRLLSSDARDYLPVQRKRSESATFEATKTSVMVSLALFPETFYFLMAKLISELSMRLQRVEQACGGLLLDLRDMGNTSIKAPNTSSLGDAAVSLTLMSKATPHEGDAAYRNFKRSLAQFRRDNRDLLVSGTELRRSPAEALTDFTRNVVNLREQKTQVENLASSLQGAHDRFVDVGWGRRCASRVSRKSANLLAASWLDTQSRGEAALLKALHTVVASEELLAKMLETARLPEDPKWSGLVSTADPYTVACLAGTCTAPFTPVEETMQYELDGVAGTLTVPAGAAAVHVFIPPNPDGFVFGPTSKVLYVEAGGTTVRFPAEVPGPVQVFLTDGDVDHVAAELVTGHTEFFASVVSGGILLYSPLWEGLTPTVVHGAAVAGDYEYLSAHDALGLLSGQRFDGLLGLTEAGLLFPELIFRNNQALLQSKELGPAGSAHITSGSDTFGFATEASDQADTMLLLRDLVGGHITSGDLLQWGEENVYEIAESSGLHLNVREPVDAGSYQASIYPPEIVMYTDIEESASVFLDALEQYGLYQSLGLLDSVGPTIPKLAERTRIAQDLYDLSEACTVMREILEEYLPRRDELTETLLASLSERGYERAGRLLCLGKFDLFPDLTYVTATTEGAVLEAAKNVYQELRTDVPYAQTRVNMAAYTEKRNAAG